MKYITDLCQTNQLNITIMTSKTYQAIKALLKDSINCNETMQQLKAGGIAKLMSWGARNYTNIDNKALLFRVSGFKHKGYVLITLAYDDTYTVYLLKLNGEIVKTMEMVYCDELTDKIDEAVEKVADYEATVKKTYGWK
jgi:hypothetical protein